MERLFKASQAYSEPATVQLLEVSTAGNLVVTLERFRARTKSRAVDQIVCVVWRISCGKCVEIWSHFENQTECDAFWEEGTIE